ncbi:2,4-dienoyl-CoA reductase [Solimonas aquatica]|uniref:2,4-dienoyl-CoA reductase n=1 Tax=Solimonas aquatica TaxID=489703 RepID=A0A1H9M038_9GAMM|nr:NADH:flavin oxidoreductase/NADH oxidase [Solimonas aquatica]SER17041.1 2,4-dienoyl-CoA reductase [Solimonas aquatica]
MSLFTPLKLRDLTLRNRIAVSPMCQYSAQDGEPNQWHLVHLGSRAVGGAGLVMAEASAVQPSGRISPADTGLWNEAQAQAWAPIAQFIRENGAVPAIQLAHAGRKASIAAPWNGGRNVPDEQGGWPVCAPSALAFDEHSRVPQALSLSQIDALVADFAAAAKRALDAGFELIELHAAHGYLLHEFLSPLSNQREDAYGGSFENRIRLVLRIVAALRAVWPERLPLLLRISATDWAPEGLQGWDLEQSCALAEALRGSGVDLIDVSSGGTLARTPIPVGPGFQTPFAAEIRRRSGIATSAVGMITAPEQADHIIRSGQADLVMLAREMLRDPYWPRRAAAALGVKIEVPPQYQRSW